MLPSPRTAADGDARATPLAVVSMICTELSRDCSERSLAWALALTGLSLSPVSPPARVASRVARGQRAAVWCVRLADLAYKRTLLCRLWTETGHATSDVAAETTQQSVTGHSSRPRRHTRGPEQRRSAAGRRGRADGETELAHTDTIPYTDSSGPSPGPSRCGMQLSKCTNRATSPTHGTTVVRFSLGFGARHSCQSTSP